MWTDFAERRSRSLTRLGHSVSRITDLQMSNFAELKKAMLEGVNDGLVGTTSTSTNVPTFQFRAISSAVDSESQDSFGR